MAADAELVDRVRLMLERESEVAERRMFGGVCFTVGGHMACGVQGADLVVRVGPQAHAAALAERHVRPMDFTGRSLQGFVYVAPPGCAESRELDKWIRRGVRFARTLPPKDARARRSRNRSERARSRERDHEPGEQMKRFMILHFGFKKPTPEIMEGWRKWFELIADKQVDQGGFGGGREISRDGTKELPWGIESITGYNIIEAEDLDAAENVARANPYIASIRVYEIRPM